MYILLLAGVCAGVLLISGLILVSMWREGWIEKHPVSSAILLLNGVVISMVVGWNVLDLYHGGRDEAIREECLAFVKKKEEFFQSIGFDRDMTSDLINCKYPSAAHTTVIYLRKEYGDRDE